MADYEVQRLNHGIGYATAAIELILPTYRRGARIKGEGRKTLRAQSAPDVDPRDRGRLRRQRLLLRLRARHGASTYRSVRTCFRWVATAICARTARWPRSPGNMPATSSSAAPCRSTPRVTAPRQRRTGSPASAARQTWAPMRADDGMTVRPGCARGRRGRRRQPCRGRKLVVQMVQTRRAQWCAELCRTAGCVRSGGGRGLRIATGDDLRR